MQVLTTKCPHCQSEADSALGETMILGPASLLTWLCAIVLLVVAGIVGYWILLSQFTTLLT